MPISYEIDIKRNLIQTTYIGPVTLHEVLEHFQTLQKDKTVPKTLNVLLDLTKLEFVPTAGQLDSAVLGMKNLSHKINWGSCAIVVTQPAMYGMSRMLEVKTEGIFKAMDVFYKPQEAQSWLDSQNTPSL